MKSGKNAVKKADIVLITSCVIMLIGLSIQHFISFKSSRIAFGDPVSARECFGGLYFLLLLIILVFFVLAFVKGNSMRLNFITGVLASAVLALFVLGVSLRYEYLPFDTSGSARMTFGIGFLAVAAALYSIMIKCSQELKSVPAGIINWLAWILIAVFLSRGYLDNYSVMREYLAQREQFFGNLWRHINISMSVLVVSVIIGIPLGYLCSRHKQLDSVTLAGISITETIPTLALFAVMRIPLAYLADRFPFLSELGIGSFGTAPAFAALLLYALYLIIHNSRAAFCMIGEELIENAYAMGMTSWDVFIKVQIPTAMPVLLSGIRITLISILVAATLASYVGGGGLGTYIVNGINALSIDMQLLGVIPIFVLTVCADYFTKYVFNLIMPGKRVKI